MEPAAFDGQGAGLDLRGRDRPARVSAGSGRRCDGAPFGEAEGRRELAFRAGELDAAAIERIVEAVPKITATK